MNLLYKLLTASRWIQRARSIAVQRNTERADLGDPAALFSLGERYHDGLGLPHDYSKAFTCFLRAAELGHRKAQTNAGMMLHLGRGTSPDPVEAVKWLTLAAHQEDPTARTTLTRIQPHLTPAQLEEGRQRARRFVTTPSGQAQTPSP